MLATSPIPEPDAEIRRADSAALQRTDLCVRKLLTADGIGIKAANSRELIFTRAILATKLKTVDERLEHCLKGTEKTDAQVPGGCRVPDTDLSARSNPCVNAVPRCRTTETLEQNSRGQLSLTDPDIQTEKAGTRVPVGLNAQIPANTKHNLIA